MPQKLTPILTVSLPIAALQVKNTKSCREPLNEAVLGSFYFKLFKMLRQTYLP